MESVIRVFMERGVARVMKHVPANIVYIVINCQDTVRNATITFGASTVTFLVR